MSTTLSITLPEWRLKKVDTARLERLQQEHQLPLPILKALCTLDLPGPEAVTEFLNPNLKKWHSDLTFPSLLSGAQCFFEAIQARKKICVHGDFDTDGMMGTYILKDLLEKLQLEHLAIIPKRGEGHGLSEKSLQRAIDWGADLLISVDCGINAIHEVEFAKQHNIDVLITDHHLPDDQLPAAKAITNPQLDQIDEFKILSGTGVALKLALCTLDLFETTPLSQQKFESFLNQALVLTAIATIADVMELKSLNRAIVQHALKQLDVVENPGIKALLKISKIKNPATTEDLSFQLIPRINSAQRMERGDLIWELFNCKTDEQAQEICEQLENLNTERRSLLEQHAKQVLEDLELKNLENEPAILVEGDSWLEGFSGLIAQRILQKYQKPAVVMLLKPDLNVVASCRSPEGWHLKEALDQCQDHIVESGGHAQAAGFRTRQDHLPQLKPALASALSNQNSTTSSGPKLMIMHELNYREITLGFFELLKTLEPFGQGNPKPIFACKGLMFDGSIRFMGKDQSHVGFKVFQPGHNSIAAVAFGMADVFRQLDLNAKFDLAFTLAISPYKHELQLLVQGIRPHRTATVQRSNHT